MLITATDDDKMADRLRLAAGMQVLASPSQNGAGVVWLMRGLYMMAVHGTPVVGSARWAVVEHCHVEWRLQCGAVRCGTVARTASTASCRYEYSRATGTSKHGKICL